jgi:hypothetical protein
LRVCYCGFEPPKKEHLLHVRKPSQNPALEIGMNIGFSGPYRRRLGMCSFLMLTPSCSGVAPMMNVIDLRRASRFRPKSGGSHVSAVVDIPYQGCHLR